jgi:hypothetical protein
MPKKTFTISVISIIILALIGGGVVWYFNKYQVTSNNNQNNENEPVAQNEGGENSDNIEEGNEKEDIDTSNWLTYRNEEYGFEFKYPKEYTIKINKEGVMDIGKRQDINILSNSDNVIISFITTSKDYTEGISEGCCFYYSGDKIDENSSIIEINKSIDMLNPISIQKTTIDNRFTVRFYSVKSYNDFWVIDSLLIPLNKKGYNLLISSKNIYSIMKNENYTMDKIKELFIQKIKKDQYFFKDSSYKIFENILESVKFID